MIERGKKMDEDLYNELKAEADMDDEFNVLFDYINSAYKNVEDKVNTYIKARDELAAIIAEADEAMAMADKTKMTLNNRQAEEFKEDYGGVIDALKHEFSDDNLTGTLKKLKEARHRY